MVNKSCAGALNQENKNREAFHCGIETDGREGVNASNDE